MFPESVDDAVEKNPFVNPIVVDVELYPVLTVNGKPDEEPLVIHVPPIA